MKGRKALAALVVGLLVGAGLVYVSTSRPPAAPEAAAVEDCEDKPPPNEFAMAAECEGDEPVSAAPAAGPEDGVR